MRYSTSEKYEIIRLVESSSLSARQTLRWLNIHRSTFYNWLHRFQDNGIDGLEDRKPRPTMAWNQIPLEHRDAIIELALDKPELSPRELAVRYTDQQAYFISEYTVYRLLKALDLITNPAYILMQAGYSFQNPSKCVNEMWQTDFTYFKIIGWGWYYLSTILDDFSRLIIAWRLCTGMGASDVADTLDDALTFTGLGQIKGRHRPRLLSDNGPCYISGELSDYLNNYYLPGELQEHLQRFITYYNHERYHESLNNLTPADVYHGCGQAILNHRETIKISNLAMRRKMHYDNRNNLNLMGWVVSYIRTPSVQIGLTTYNLG